MRRLWAALFLIVPLSTPAAELSWPERKEFQIQSPVRLHDWLLSEVSAKRLPDDAALSWISLIQKDAQDKEVTRLQEFLSKRSLMAAGDPLGAIRLNRFIESLPYRGRVALPSTDARWLELNPDANPILRAGDRMVSYERSKIITLVLTTGQLCHIEHRSGQHVQAYVDSCLQLFEADRLQRALHSPFRENSVWIAQPDGQIFQAHLDPERDMLSPEPAPGAWIWVPQGWAIEQEWFSRAFIELLAAQGPVGDYLRYRQLEALRPVQRRTPQALTRSQWGSVGLIQMPSARMSPEGTLSISRTLSGPYRRVNVMVQAMPWMEFGLRYTDIRNRLYGQQSFSGDQTYIDKSLDLKLRLIEENEFWPQISIGMIDAVGTGLFSSEYIAATKRLGAFDVTGGLAFGVMGAGGSISNPIGLIKERYKNRQQANTGMGGNPGFTSWFTGAMSPFIGIEWTTPWLGWAGKIEYSANDGSREPHLGGSLYSIKPPSSRLNYGMVYRISDWIDLSFGIERGYQFVAGLNLYTSLNKKPLSKILDTPPPAVFPMSFSPQSDLALRDNGWSRVAEEIRKATLWEVESLQRQDRDLHLRFLKTDGPYLQDRVELIGRVLHQHAPRDIQRFIIHVANSGIDITSVVINRQRFVQDRIEFLPPIVQISAPAVLELDPSQTPRLAEGVLHDGLGRAKPGDISWSNFSGRIGSSYSHLLGGPTGFWLFELGVRARAEWRPLPSTWAELTANYRLIDNYNEFYNNPTRSLPPVRTLLRSYIDSDRFTLPNVQFTHLGKVNALGANHFYSAYAGYLETMFGGVGAEYLYRPWKGPLAVGVDLNWVKQRDFEQKFGFLNYAAKTGHATLYWDTGWSGILVKAKAGQYLAGDRGVTLDVSRTLLSGATIGALATKTNVSAAEFGEGSFDKVLYLQIPFDLLLPKRSSFEGLFAWRNLTSHAGAILGRRHGLYSLTDKRDPRALQYGTQ
jgi:hypothetical protein